MRLRSLSPWAIPPASAANRRFAPGWRSDGGACFRRARRSGAARSAGARTALDVPIATVASPDEAGAVFATRLPVLPVKLAHTPRPGHPDKANAQAVIASIERAASLALRGAAGGMVTNPINKAALYDAGFAYPGHTEFLAALTGAHGRQIMMLASPRCASFR